jgi:hypothetical protein
MWRHEKIDQIFDNVPSSYYTQKLSKYTMRQNSGKVIKVQPNKSKQKSVTKCNQYENKCI